MKRRYLGLAVGLAAVVVAAGLALRTAQPGLPISPGVQQILEAQKQLSPQELAAVQALRVFAAVSLAYFTDNGRYAEPEELKSKGYLDPKWPRVAADAYTIDCRIGEGTGFACFADPVSGSVQRYFFVDPSQTVRVERDRRPDSNSPVFGLSKEQSR